MRTRKRLLSMILVLTMALTMLPTAVLAEDETGGSGPAPQADAGITTADALAEAVTQGGEVTLGGDITLNSMLVIGCGQTVAIDLGGHTLTGADDTAVLRALGRSSLTVKNGKIQMGGLSDRDAWVWGIDNRGGTVTVEGVTITGVEGDGVTANLDNISDESPEENLGGTTTLKNCSIDVTYGNAAGAYRHTESRVVFDEGCFVRSGSLEAWESDDGSKKAVIEAKLGARFSDDVKEYVTLPEGAILFRGDGESGYTVVLESGLTPAATVGETRYYTLRDAISNAADGATVTVQRDLDTKTASYAVRGKSITLDLNGKKVTMTRPNSSNSVPISVSSGAGLTVKDSGGQGELHLLYPQAATFSGHMIESGGSFTLEGGAIIAGGQKPRYDTYYVIEARSGSLTISGGSVTIPGDWAADRKTVHAGNSTTVSVTGGTFTNLDAAYVAEGYVAVPQLDGSVQVMARTEDAVAIVGSEQYTSLTEAFTAANGGTVTLLSDISEASSVGAGASAALNLAGHAVTGKLTSAGELTILDSKTGGSVEDIESSGVVAITGGRINGMLTAADGGSFVITGGSFANEFDEKWCAAGYSAVKGSDDRYTLGIDSQKWANDAAKKGEDGAYLIENEADMIRFAAYVNAGNALAGQTVRLATDLDFSGCDYLPVGTASASFNGAFDGGNHTISNAAVSADKIYAGIFGVTGAQAEIKNLCVKDSNFALPIGQYTYAGGIVSKAGGSVTNCTAEHVRTNGWFSGAIVGHTYGMTISQVTVTGCDAGSAKAGGVVGYAGNLHISEATVIDTVASGAMVGHANGDTVLENIVVSSTGERTPLIGTAYETKKTVTVTGDGTDVDVSKIVGDSTGPADVVLSGGTYQVSEPTAVSSGSTLTIGDVTIASTSGEAIATLEESARVVKNDGTITTVAGGGASEATGSVDQYGNLILPAGSTVQKGEEGPTVIGNDSVITPNGNIVQGTADEPPTVDAATGVVTVPAGGTVMTPAGEVAQMPNGGTVTPPANEGGDAGDIVKPTIIVTLDKTALSLTVGGEETLAVTVNPKDSAEAVAWSSDKPAVAEVAGGVVTAVAPGIADITVSVTTAYGVETAVCKVTVNPALTPIDPDSKAAAYRVEHYKESLDGGYKLADTDFPLYYELGEVVDAEPRIYTGYTLDAENENAVPSGTVTLPEPGEDGPVILTLKLYYKLNEYTVDFDSDGGSAVAGQTVKYGGKAEKPENPTKSGYTFTGWYLDGKAFDFGAAIADNVTLTAQWSKRASGGGSSGGGSSTSYTVSVESGKNGSVTVSPKNAGKGGTVTITVKPDKGYGLDELTVTDKNGDALKLTDKGNGKYTFTMPASKVTVEASFAKTEERPVHAFADVPGGYWAENEIAWAYEQGYMNGNTAVTFNPDGTVSRQQLWMILARLSGSDPATMAEAKAWAVASGVSDGTNPGRAVSRQQLVTILYRFAALMGYDVSGTAGLTAFPDHGSVAAYAADAMSWSVANNIVGGTAQGTLNPNGTATRAQFAAILYRFCEKTVK